MFEIQQNINCNSSHEFTKNETILVTFSDWLELCTVHYEPANFALVKLELIVF